MRERKKGLSMSVEGLRREDGTEGLRVDEVEKV